ncbi:MAG: hypothetical protein SynsKO_28690 [Synoicihabitans sp.]
MRKIVATPLLTLLTSLLTGCAGVKYYSDAGGENPTALRIHQPKPYLLVTRSPDPTAPPAVSLVTLPDFSPDGTVYVKRQSGIGTAEFNFTLSNGALSTWSDKADPKVTELITALTGGYGSVATGIAGMDTAAATLLGAQNAASMLSFAGSSVRTTQLAGQVSIVADQIPPVITAAITDGRLTPDTQRLAVAINTQLTAASQHITENGADEIGMGMIRDAIDLIKNLQGQMTSVANDPLAPRFVYLIATLESLIGSLRLSMPREDPGKGFELYEIKWDGSKIELTLVDFA